jgi:CDP-diglyceride synthetase
MTTRQILIVTALLAGFLAAALFLSPVWWGMLIALMAGVAAWEWGSLTGLKALHCNLFGGVMLFVCAELVISEYVDWYCFTHPTYTLEGFLAYFEYFRNTFVPWYRFVPWPLKGGQIGFITPFTHFFIYTFFILVVPFWLWKHWRLNQTRWKKGVLLVLGFFLIFSVSLAFMRWKPISHINSPGTLVVALGIAWIAEISAYFSTKKFGGRKLNPEISSDKTWAGFWGAMVGVFVYALFFVLFVSPKPATWGRAIVIPILFLFYAILGTGGNLFILLLKRQAGIENSGGIFSRHGGVLERISGQIPILPLFPYFLP